MAIDTSQEHAEQVDRGPEAAALEQPLGVLHGLGGNAVAAFEADQVRLETRLPIGTLAASGELEMDADEGANGRATKRESIPTMMDGPASHTDTLPTDIPDASEAPGRSMTLEGIVSTDDMTAQYRPSGTVASPATDSAREPNAGSSWPTDDRGNESVDDDQTVAAAREDISRDVHDEVADPTLEARRGIFSLFMNAVSQRDAAAAEQLSGCGGKLDEAYAANSKGAPATMVARCGSMEDLTGLEDPYGFWDGFFHEILVYTLGFEHFKTDYDRACDEWFRTHPGVLY